VLHFSGYSLVVVSVRFLVLETAGATSVWFGLGTYFRPDSVHAQHVSEVYSV